MSTDRDDIVFVFLPSGRSLDNTLYMSLTKTIGSAYVIAYLNNKGFNARQIISKRALDVYNSAKLCLQKRPRVVGFTVYNTNYPFSVMLARQIKTIDPNVIIVMGGPTATVQAEMVLKTSNIVDVCVRNMGEETTEELLVALQQNNWRIDTHKMSKISGLSFKNNDYIQDNPDRIFPRRVHDFLDKYPSPYLTGLIDDVEPGILTGRGCNQNCTFCNCAVLSHRRWFTHSIERVVEELYYICNVIRPNEVVNIWDDAFTMLPDRAATICEQIIKNNIKLSLRCITRCDLIDKNLIVLMKRAGFDFIGFSLESATPHVLRNIGKVRPPETLKDPLLEKEKAFIESFKENVQYVKETGGFAFASIMLGLPGETKEEGCATIEMIKSLELPLYAHNILQVFPGTPLFKDCEKYGITKKVNGHIFTTIHAYDPFEIPLAPNSNIEKTAREEQRHNVKLLALESRDVPSGDFFTNIIYTSNNFKPELANWLCKHLAINGRILQIFDDKISFKKFRDSSVYHEDREGLIPSALDGVPTRTGSIGYNFIDKSGQEGIHSSQYFIWGERCNFPVYISNSKNLSGKDAFNKNYANSVFMEKSIEDSELTVRTLKNIAAEHDVAEINTLPHFAQLCHWGTGKPNCVTLETLIIDQNLNIRTCWNGSPIGKVGEDFGTIKKRTLKVRKSIIKKRQCMLCNAKSYCSVCLFPAPMTENQYCTFQQDENVGKGAYKVRCITMLQDLVLQEKLY